MTRRRFWPTSVRLSWPAALALAFALLCAQTLGTLHSLQHGNGLPRGAARQALVAKAVAATEATSLGATLWSHAAGHADCQLLDQLLHADLLPQVTLALSADTPRPPRLATWAAVALHGRLEQPYQARAPPLLA
ncbi:hypothetical protein [Ideonella sp.]|uniref:hypothetical protein n=1 Tax=Ideonella sp. TaxID=1929293 RepID=UPI002D8068F6|nr:hypothetical protein [Ideonella sp.]